MVVGGGGQMGNGIAQVAATAGFEVTLDLDAAGSTGGSDGSSGASVGW